jgi:D-3-phosphoglycerate dehydrogenase
MPTACVWTHGAFHPAALSCLAPPAAVITGAQGGSPEWLALVAACDAIILDGQTYLHGEQMDRIGSRLRIVARTGIGVDRIDIAAATERGILVMNTPDGPTESTAEHAVALMLNLAKGVCQSDRLLREGHGFAGRAAIQPGLELDGATLGLIGLGRIGGRVAEIARVLGMRVLAFDPFVMPERAAALGVELVPTLPQLLAASDVVSIHCPATPDTHHLLNASMLAHMRPGSFLINVSRGPLIDEAALLDALRSGQIAGAGLDVFDPEPPADDNPLFALPNTICTAHIGSYTHAGTLRMQTMACEQVAMALRSERPPNILNPEVWERVKR